MNYELAKQLKNAGFPMLMPMEGERVREAFGEDERVYLFPNLSELIEACGDKFTSLLNAKGSYTEIDPWEAWFDTDNYGLGSTPEEAVAMLWLELHKK